MRGRKSPFVLVLLIIAAASVLVFPWLAMVAGQDASWDLYNYHFYNPWALLNDRFWFDIQPAQRQTFFNPMLDLPFYWLTQVAGIQWASRAYAAFQGLQGPALFALAWMLMRAHGVPVRAAVMGSALVTILGLAAPLNVHQIGTAIGDAATGTLVLAGLALMFFAAWRSTRDHDGGRQWAIMGLAGGLMGLAVGLKLTNAPHAVAAALCVAWFPVAGARRIEWALVFGCAAALGFLLAYGYWGWFLFSETGNPFFPQFNHIFQSDYINLAPFTDDKFKARDAVEWLFYPFVFNPLGEAIHNQRFADLRFPVAYLLIIAAVVVGLARRIRARDGLQTGLAPALLAYFAISYLLWQWVFSITRYVLVLEVLAPLLALGASLWLFGPRVRAALPALIALIAMGGYTVVALDGRQAFGPRVKWTESPFQVVFPRDDLAGAIILVSGGQAVSFVISSAPPSTRFVRIDSNLYYNLGFQTVAERYDNALGRRIREAIAGHGGALFALFAPGEEGFADSDLAELGLGRLPETCQPIDSKGRIELLLCEVVRDGR